MLTEPGQILAALPRFREAAEELRETILADLVMIGEIPAPTFGEEERLAFFRQRLGETGVQRCSLDELGNAVGVIEGCDGERAIAVVAHADTIFPASLDHSITVKQDAVTGPGVADNSLGLASLLILPALLERLDLRLSANLILMGEARSLGRGNLKGLRFFLNHSEFPLDAGICVEGVQLGRLSFHSLGMFRGEITCSIPEEYDWTRFGASGAVVTLNEVISKMLEIPLPRRPRTSILLGSIAAGTGYNTIARKGSVRFEIRSECPDTVRRVRERIEDIVTEVSSQTGEGLSLDIFASRTPGGIAFEHPMIRSTRQIMRALDVEPRISPSMSELSAFIDLEVPSVTIGITTAEDLNERWETIRIQPMFTGLAQLVGLIAAVDAGYGHED